MISAIMVNVTAPRPKASCWVFKKLPTIKITMGQPVASTVNIVTLVEA